MSRVTNAPAALVLTLGFLAAACTPTTDRPRSSTDPVTTLTIFYGQGGADVTAVTPQDGGTGMHLLFLPLFERVREGEVEGALVESWEHSADYRRWTYHLRPNVRWHDGVPVTARDVEFSYRTYMHPDVLRMVPACDVTVIDDLTFTIDVGHGCWADDSWNVILPSHLLGDLEGEEVWRSSLWQQPVGNGPYRFARYTDGTAIELDANPDFYAGKPPIDRVIVRLLPGANPVTELQAGTVDIAPATLAAAALLAGDERFAVYHGLPQVGWPIVWNHYHPVLGDRTVREALTLAADKHEIGLLYHYPEGIPIVDVPLSPSKRDRMEIPPPIPHDPARALYLLHAAGWREAEPGDVLARDGLGLKFELLADPVSMQAAVMIQEQLSRIGVTVELRSMDRGLIRQNVLAGEFEAAIVAGLKGSGLLTTLAGEPPDWQSPIGYRNPNLPALVTAAESSLDPAAIERAYLQIEEIFRRDLPMSMVVPNMGNASVVAHRKVKGLTSPLLWFPEMIVEQLWIEEEE